MGTCENKHNFGFFSNVNSIFFILLLVSGLSIFVVDTAFADQPINNRIEIDDDDIPADIDADDLFGYNIKNIDDLDGDGVKDLAVIKFEDDTGETDAGSVLILFMNSNGSVKSTSEITHTDTAGTGFRGASQGAGACIIGDSTNRDPFSLEQMAYVGDLDNDGEPTLAVVAEGNDHAVTNSGAIYMLELNSDGTVDNCLRIIPGENGFSPAAGVYREGGGAFLGWPLIATDLNGDGQNELLAGASNEADTSTDLWPLFLTTTGAVSSHPATPIFGITDIGIDSGDYISDGHTVNDGTKIIVGVQNGAADDSGSIFIVTLTSAGAFSSSTEITGTSLSQGIAGNDNFGRGVTPLGDMDNDGVNDILVAAFTGDDVNINSGESFILFMNSNDSVKSSQKISNLSPIDGTVSTFLATGDFFGHGMALWTESGNDAMIAFSAHSDDTGGSTAGAIHLLSITRNSETVIATETDEEDFTVTLNDVSVGVSDSGTDTKTITIEQLNSNPEPLPVPGNLVGFVYDITGNGTLNNITLTITYTDAEISELIEDSLIIYRFTGGEWVALETTVNEDSNSATASTSGFSSFALSGRSAGSFDSGINGHGKQLDKKCKADGFGKGKSLDIISIFITKEIGNLRGVSVDLSTTCGPASVRVSNEYGTKIAGLSFSQSDYDDKTTIPVLKYISDIEGDSKKITINAKDKRDIFVKTVYLTSDRLELNYNSTGYTSEQQNSANQSIKEKTTELIEDTSTIENVVFDSSLPPQIKNSLDQWTGYPSRDHFFFDSVAYLIDHDYIQFTNWQKSYSLQEQLSYPDWVLDSVDFYSEEQLSDDELLNMIEYMVNNRIVRIGR